MAREGDVTRVFLARASLHYDAARAAFCPVATQFRSRGTPSEHTEPSRAPVNVSARTARSMEGNEVFQ